MLRRNPLEPHMEEQASAADEALFERLFAIECANDEVAAGDQEEQTGCFAPAKRRRPRREPWPGRCLLFCASGALAPSLVGFLCLLLALSQEPAACWQGAPAPATSQQWRPAGGPPGAAHSPAEAAGHSSGVPPALPPTDATHNSTNWPRRRLARSEVAPPPPPPPPLQSKAGWQRNKLGQLHGQLVQLRRQLELELELRRSSSAPGSQVALGSPCLKSSDCSENMPATHCDLTDFTCACNPQHVQFNSTTCLAPSLLGFECLIDAQCEKKVANSRCLQGLCTCHSNFVTYRKDKCLPASQIDDYCLADGQCQLADRHSYCKWKIPNVYGLCRCPPNYKLISLASPDSDRPTSNSSSSLRGLCLPRLGDICLEGDHCGLATPHSTCRPAERADALRFVWRSSLAQSDRRCLCEPGYAESSDRLRCEPAPAPAPVVMASAGSMDRKNQYELLAASDPPAPPNSAATPEPAEASGPASPLLSSAAAAASTTPVAAPTGPPARALAASLGQPCSGSRECQLADPNSHCEAGRCECRRPAAACSANATGCHPDTFQCRSSGQCISWYFVCDRVRNCADGSDEDLCRPGSCPPQAFQCDDGACLARAKLCNGRPECADGSDERHCGRRPELAAWQPDAAVAADSRNRSSAAARCHPKAFACDSGQCLPGHALCNAVADCADGSDEQPALCDRAWYQAQRRRWPPAGDQWRFQPTDSPVVVRAGPGAPGRPARPPRSSGGGGGGGRSLAALECPKWSFTCRNGKCRSSAVACSGVDGCGDNSDEDRCQVCRCAPAPN